MPRVLVALRRRFSGRNLPHSSGAVFQRRLRHVGGLRLSALLLLGLPLERERQGERQRQGRLLLWDRPIDAEQQAAFRQGRVRQQAYVYQTKT